MLHRSGRASHWALLATCGLAASGCAEPAVRIIGSCELSTDAINVVPALRDEPRPEGAWVMGPPAFGVLGDHFLVSWGEWDATSGWPPERAYRYSRWLGPELRDPFDNEAIIHQGRSRWVIDRPKWVALDGALHAQIWSDPEDGPFPLREEDTVAFWSLQPSGEAQRTPIDLPALIVDCPECAEIGLEGLFASPGFDGFIPTVVARGALWGALVARPGVCGWGVDEAARLLLTRSTEARASTVRWTDLCDNIKEPWVSSPLLLSLHDGALAALFRLQAPADSALYFLRFRDDGSPIGQPVRVGTRPASEVDGGFQPRAVAVPGGRILFTDRRGDSNECHALRIMDEDGSDAEDAPWQLPCRSRNHPITSSVELLAIPSGAVLVWSERTRVQGLRVTINTPYEEAVRAVILTPEGQRGSEILTLTDPDATTLVDSPRTETDGPFPGVFLPSAASDGESMIAGWQDARTTGDGPGDYARRFRCTVGE